MFKFSYNLG